jgi:hypothetical protein
MRKAIDVMFRMQDDTSHSDDDADHADGLTVIDDPFYGKMLLM